MSENKKSVEDRKAALAEIAGTEIDPLAVKAPMMQAWGEDGFEMFLDDILRRSDVKEKSIWPYETTYRQWKAFMEKQGRHPTCPSPGHVEDFVQQELDDGNALRTVRTKLAHLNRAYTYWQNEGAFPHQTDFNPFKSTRDRLNNQQVTEKDFPPFTIEDIAETVKEVKHVRDRAIIMTQLKLGLRSGELCNIKLSEINIDPENSDLRHHYPEIGSNRHVEGRPESVFIPCDREGNKSRRDRILPIDEELHVALKQYLYLRPDNGEPWLFLSNNSAMKMIPNNINDRWRKYWHPKWAPTDEYRGVVAHFGRHVFTTYFRSISPIEHEWVKYMRGDITSDLPSTGHKAEAIDRYIHTKYEDVEPVYRAEIFRFSDHW
jgi:integrase/recombinase XerD